MRYNKNSAANQDNGRYTRGGNTEIVNDKLGWWDKKMIQVDPSDIVYVMESKYEGRPDLLGFVFYNDTKLWWIICQYNGILDPMNELKEGKVDMVLMGTYYIKDTELEVIDIALYPFVIVGKEKVEDMKELSKQKLIMRDDSPLTLKNIALFEKKYEVTLDNRILVTGSIETMKNLHAGEAHGMRPNLHKRVRPRP